MKPSLKSLCRHVSGAALLLSVTACAQLWPRYQPPELEGVTPEPGSMDLALSRVAVRVPGFAGAHVDAEQSLHVKLVGGALDTANAGAIRSAFETAGLLSPASAGVARIVLERSNTRSTWSELNAYKAAMRDVLALPDVSFLDADEVAGVVTIGIAKEEARAKVQEFAVATGIPADAWVAVISPFRERHADVRDTLRPIVGGTQIMNDRNPFFFLGLSSYCTLGVVAERGTVPGFITNSHCTRTQGGTEQTNFYQNGAFNYVAHESVDPPWTASMAGCPMGTLCRRSDSAFAVIDIGNQNALMGAVARPATLCSSGAPCSTAMNSPTDRITLTGTAAAPLVGSFITKVGRTGGWTGGLVTRTCIDVRQLGSNFVVLCQSEFANGSIPGDSGSPVIVVPASTSGGAPPSSGTLAGILWGGSATTSVFSPIDAVVQELGGPSLFPTPVTNGGPPGPGPSTCVTACRSARDSCMREAAGGDWRPRPQACVGELRACLASCEEGGVPRD